MSSSQATHVLLVEHRQEDTGVIRGLLDQHDDAQISVTPVSGLSSALAQLGEADLVLWDCSALDGGFLQDLAKLRAAAPHLPIVVLTAEEDEELGRRAIRWGAEDYLVKTELDSNSLGRAIRYALERKYAERALRESDQRFRTVFENGHFGMALVSSDSRFVRVNAALCRMLEYSERELAALTFPEITHEDDVEESVALTNKLFAGEIPPFQFEKRYVKKDGGTVWASVTVSAVRDDEDRSSYAIAMLENITERRQAEERVRGSYNLLHAVIGGTTDPVFVKDREGRYQLLNSAAARILGREPDDVVGRRDRDFLPLETAEEVEKLDRLIMVSGATRTVEQTMTVEGEERTFLTTNGVYRDQRGKVAGLFGIGHDITDRKRAEEIVRESEQKYRDLFEHATYGIYRSTVDGKFVAVNPALVEMLGYDSPLELMEVDIASDVYCNPSDRAAFVAKCGSDGAVGCADVQWRKRDGALVGVRLNGRAICDETGSVSGFEVIAEDVTERRALESQLRQAQKMEAVGQLTGGIAHDLNNILTVVLANVESVASGLPPEFAQFKEDLEETLAATNRGAALIKKLLGFSRKGKLDVKPIDIPALVSDLSAMLRRVVPESIEITLSVDADAGTVLADAGSIEQIMLNLATNARDAMPDGGSLEISVGRVTLGAELVGSRSGDYVCISVNDTGEGMDEQTRQRIYEPFFTTKPPGIGTGLGMAMVYGIIRQQEGVVDVESEVGVGTTVKLYLPLRGEKSATSPPPVRQSKDQACGTETILVVEDEDLIRTAARRALEKHGYTVIAAGNGVEGLEVYRSRKSEIDLVVSDVVMPKMGGPELYEKLKEEGDPPRIIFTSGYAERQVHGKGVLDTTLPFLAKPWELAGLLQMVREVLDRQHEPA